MSVAISDLNVTYHRLAVVLRYCETVPARTRAVITPRPEAGLVDDAGRLLCLFRPTRAHTNQPRCTPWRTLPTQVRPGDSALIEFSNFGADPVTFTADVVGDGIVPCPPRS